MLEGLALSLRSNAEADLRLGPFYRLSVDQYRDGRSAHILTPTIGSNSWKGGSSPRWERINPVPSPKGLTYQRDLRIPPRGWFVATEDPVRAFDSEPEPDICRRPGVRRDYASLAPGPASCLGLIEVAHASLKRDRSMKKRLYARLGIP